MDEKTKGYYETARSIAGEAHRAKQEAQIRQTSANAAGIDSKVVTNQATAEKINNNFESSEKIPKKPLHELTPEQQYQSRFAEYNSAYKSPGKRGNLSSGDKRLEGSDYAIGKEMILKGGCNKYQVEEQFKNHSPYAAKIEKLQGVEARDKYCRERAELCDRKANIPREDPQRSKYQSHEAHPSMAKYPSQEQMAAYLHHQGNSQRR